MFKEFSNQELVHIFSLNPKTEKVKAIILKENNIDDRVILQDHAFGEYWNRKFKEISSLENVEVESILKYIEFPTAKGILGDAAKRGMLNKEQCDRLLRILSKEEWAFKAIKSRILLFSFFDKCKHTPPDIENIINEFIEFKMTWAILEILPCLNRDELVKLRERMTQKSILNKSNRHRVRVGIDKIIKERKQPAR